MNVLNQHKNEIVAATTLLEHNTMLGIAQWEGLSLFFNEDFYAKTLDETVRQMADTGVRGRNSHHLLKNLCMLFCEAESQYVTTVMIGS